MGLLINPFIQFFEQLPYDPVLWLDAKDSNTLTVFGSSVSQWNDKSGNGNHAVQSIGSSQPSYDGTPKITFDGVNDFLDLSDATGLDITGKLTMFIVAEIDPTAGVCYLLARNGADSSEIQYASLFFPDTDSFALYLNGGDRDRSPIYTFGTKAIVSSIYDKALPEVFLNGSSDGSGTYSLDLTTRTNMFIGARSNAADGSLRTLFLKGSISEIIIYPDALTTLQRTTVESYLSAKWV